MSLVIVVRATDLATCVLDPLRLDLGKGIRSCRMVRKTLHLVLLLEVSGDLASAIWSQIEGVLINILFSYRLSSFLKTELCCLNL